MSRSCGQLVLTQRVVDKMLEFAWSAYPGEAVGLLGGTRRKAKTVYALRNLASGLEFFADPRDQYQSIQRIKRAGTQLVAIFHSHPEGAPRLSEEDRKYVFDVASTSIVIALSAVGHTSHIAAFSRSSGRCEEIVDILVMP
jgi:proteasome lid subunit RPN8/RPN11